MKVGTIYKRNKDGREFRVMLISGRSCILQDTQTGALRAENVQHLERVGITVREAEV